MVSLCKVIVEDTLCSVMKMLLSFVVCDRLYMSVVVVAVSSSCSEVTVELYDSVVAVVESYSSLHWKEN